MTSICERTPMGTRSEITCRAQYKKTHTKIVKGILKLMRRFRVKVTTKQLSEETGLPPMTIRNHGKDLNKILSDEEAALLGQFLLTIDKMMLHEEGENASRGRNKKYFNSLLLFIAKNRQEFLPIFEDRNNWELLRNMITTIYEDLYLAWFPISDPIPSPDSEAGEMFIVIAAQLISRWGRETECDIGRVGVCEQRLQTLAEQMYSRCRF